MDDMMEGVTEFFCCSPPPPLHPKTRRCNCFFLSLSSPHPSPPARCLQVVKSKRCEQKPTPTSRPQSAGRSRCSS